MKTKIKSRAVFVMVILCAVAACYALNYLVDSVWNGVFLDWFSNYFMITYESGSLSDGTFYQVTEPNWPMLKQLALTVLILNTVFWIVVVRGISQYHGKAEVKKSVTRTGQLIRAYMQSDKDAAEIFPKEYAEISAEMVEVKSKMVHHEAILKEEAVRKNDLIAYLAHDLKTPLTSVIGYLSLLDEAGDMPVEQRAKYIGITLDKAQRLEKLINEFFDITRYNLQQIDLEKEEINLSFMLVQMVDEFYPLMSSHGLTVKLEADENLKVYGDAMKLARVFNNILKNAVAYSYRDTVIKVWVETSEQEVRIYFQNRGKTIPEKRLESIFEKFFRLDEARTSDTGGAGLGLAIAKEIAALHGGSITARSKDEVTTFCVTLPC